jgi:hypothetical protein
MGKILSDKAGLSSWSIALAMCDNPRNPSDKVFEDPPELDPSIAVPDKIIIWIKKKTNKKWRRK